MTAAIDIADRARFETRLALWIATYGGIDHLVNAAGILEADRLLDAPADSPCRVTETNFLAALKLTLPVGRHMVARRQGSITTTGSNQATTPRVGLGIFPASKSAITHAMKYLGLELAEYGMRCNVVSPGSTYTKMQREAQAAASGLGAVLNGDPKT